MISLNLYKFHLFFWFKHLIRLNDLIFYLFFLLILILIFIIDQVDFSTIFLSMMIFIWLMKLVLLIFFHYKIEYFIFNDIVLWLCILNFFDSLKWVLNGLIKSTNSIKRYQTSFTVSLYLPIVYIMYIMMHIIKLLWNERRLFLTALAYINNTEISGLYITFSRIFWKLIEILKPCAVYVMILLDVIIAPFYLIFKSYIR